MYDTEVMSRVDTACCHNADAVLTTSHDLQIRCEPKNRNTTLIGHGVNWDHFSAPLHAVNHTHESSNENNQKCSFEINRKCSGEVVPRQTATGGRPIRRAAHGVPVGHESEVQPRDYTSSDQEPSTKDQEPSLVFIGDGSMLSDLKEIAVGLNIVDQVHFLGRRPHDEIPLWLNSAECLLLSSHSEGMPNAIAEALACGCPVVATDVGACKEMLTNQPCCNVIPPNNPKAMAIAIEATLEEAKKTKKRPTFTRTWANMAEEMLRLIRY